MRDNCISVIGVAVLVQCAGGKVVDATSTRVLEGFEQVMVLVSTVEVTVLVSTVELIPCPELTDTVAEMESRLVHLGAGNGAAHSNSFEIISVRKMVSTGKYSCCLLQAIVRATADKE